ncbi:MAG: ABC transporter ATP-binding protein [Flavobacteriales bacterium]
MAAPIITVEGLSKQFLLKHQQAERYTALRDVIANKAKGLFRKSAPGATREEFMALNEISFTVEQGDRLGIIGRNGAGKSTLLKVLSRIVEPTKGRITIDGRVASLLEVGTGFHPELTGRENIYLNGAILGMTRAEISSKFDEIVAFSEVENFLDTPVKRYSSGMYMRLAFAVAAHLESEIMIVDEVLAVGDAAFQRKCLGKMESVAGEGRTVLFVSHQMDAVQRLCNKGLLLDHGHVITAGPMRDVVEHYLQLNTESASEFHFDLPPHFEPRGAVATSLRVEDKAGKPTNELALGAPWQVRVRFQVDRPLENFVIAIGVVTMLDYPIRTTWSAPRTIAPGRYEAVFISDGIVLTEGQYKLAVGIDVDRRNIHHIPGAGVLTVSDVASSEKDERIVSTGAGVIVNQMEVRIEAVG